MEKKGISQEALKLIACMTMLADHIGAVIVLKLYYGNPTPGMLEFYNGLRIIGRIAFPVYCFLLAEGSFHTGNPRRYCLRLALWAALSEIPYDLALHEGISWQRQSVMVTLLLGFCALEMMKKCPNLWSKLLISAPFALFAEFAQADYGAEGVLLIVLFSVTREVPNRWLIQFLGMWFLFSPGHGMLLNWLNGIQITTQEWAVLALIPIAAYSGEKKMSSKLLQWGFYMFYPLHLLVLCGIGRL